MGLMAREHSTMADSHAWFEPSNFRIASTSRIEWLVVVDPSSEALESLQQTKSYQGAYCNLADWPMPLRSGESERSNADAASSSTRGERSAPTPWTPSRVLSLLLAVDSAHSPF